MKNAPNNSEVLNNLHPALAFTLVSRRTTSGYRSWTCSLSVRMVTFLLLRSIYRKPTFPGLYTRWDSFSPTSHKIGLIRSLTSRAHKICSPSMLDLEISKLKTIFANNGYPSMVVDRVIRQTLERRSGDSKGKAEKTTSPSVTICLPWIGHSSTTLGKEIREAITKGYPKVTPRTIFTTNKAISGRAKDVLPMLSKSNVVYEFKCCCGQTYIGKIIQRLTERAKQHPAFQALHGGARSEDPQVRLGHHKTCEAEHLVPG